MDTNRDPKTETKETVIPSDGAPAPAAGEEVSEFKIQIASWKFPSGRAASWPVAARLPVRSIRSAPRQSR